MKNSALIVAGLVFTAVTIIHAIRYLKGWEVVIANYPIPLQGSFYGGIITGLLALWMFVAAARNNPPR